MIRVEVDRPPLRFGYDVWIYEREGDEGVVRLARYVEGRWEWERIENHTDRRGMEPSLNLPDEVASALGAGLLEVVPPDRAAALHLKDTMEVRDRLLALVEGFATVPRVRLPE